MAEQAASNNLLKDLPLEVVGSPTLWTALQSDGRRALKESCRRGREVWLDAHPDLVTIHRCCANPGEAADPPPLQACSAFLSRFGSGGLRGLRNLRSLRIVYSVAADPTGPVAEAIVSTLHGLSPHLRHLHTLHIDAPPWSVDALVPLHAAAIRDACPCLQELRLDFDYSTRQFDPAFFAQAPSSLRTLELRNWRANSRGFPPATLLAVAAGLLSLHHLVVMSPRSTYHPRRWGEGEEALTALTRLTHLQLGCTAAVRLHGLPALTRIVSLRLSPCMELRSTAFGVVQQLTLLTRLAVGRVCARWPAQDRLAYGALCAPAEGDHHHQLAGLPHALPSLRLLELPMTPGDGAGRLLRSLRPFTSSRRANPLRIRAYDEPGVHEPQSGSGHLCLPEPSDVEGLHLLQQLVQLVAGVDPGHFFSLTCPSRLQLHTMPSVLQSLRAVLPDVHGLHVCGVPFCPRQSGSPHWAPLTALRRLCLPGVAVPRVEVDSIRRLPRLLNLDVEFVAEADGVVSVVGGRAAALPLVEAAAALDSAQRAWEYALTCGSE